MVPVMPMIFPWSMAIRWSVASFDPAAMISSVALRVAFDALLGSYVPFPVWTIHLTLDQAAYISLQRRNFERVLQTLYTILILRFWTA